MALLLDVMPAAWAAHINGPSPQPTHLASADSADRRIFCPFGAGIDPRIGTVRGHRPASGVRLVRVPPNQTCYRTPGAKRVWNCASSGGRAPC